MRIDPQQAHRPVGAEHQPVRAEQRECCVEIAAQRGFVDFGIHHFGDHARDFHAEDVVAFREFGHARRYDGQTEDDFVAMREARDAKLDMPRLILPSVQVNMRAGHMPAAEENGVTYLKIPVNAV